MKIRDVLKQLLPNGPAPAPGSRLPHWPPDAFAVAATLVNVSGTYAHPRFTAGWAGTDYEFGTEFGTEIAGIGQKWRKSATMPLEAAKLWREITRSRDKPVSCPSGAPESWQTAAMRLMAIADEACLDIGFFPHDHDNGIAQTAYHLLYQQVQRASPSDLLPHLPMSLCQMVPPTAACVQPKTSAPGVGCTLRSLTHNIALLPPTTAVETKWIIAHPASSPDNDEHRPLNLLLIPLPFTIKGSDFVAVQDHADANNRFFTLEPSWLIENGEAVSADRIAGFITRVIDAARSENPDIHGVLLPETALLAEQADAVALLLAEHVPGLELFIVGVLAQHDRNRPRNLANTYRIHEKQLLYRWSQAKHHRWRLDGGQIKRYHIGHRLDPTCNWWEQVDMSNRVCHFTVVRQRTSLAVLICEDLARVDPVLPVVNAIGPNLVIALLMDGPQLERRWPGRYATVLADDPGSSVLTFTSLGLIRRSTEAGKPELRTIALWKEPDGAAHELFMPADHHGLLISLTSKPVRQTTLDSRRDKGTTYRLSLSAAQPVKATHASGEWPPDH